MLHTWSLILIIWLSKQKGDIQILETSGDAKHLTYKTLGSFLKSLMACLDGGEKEGEGSRVELAKN